MNYHIKILETGNWPLKTIQYMAWKYLYYSINALIKYVMLSSTIKRTISLYIHEISNAW